MKTPPILLNPHLFKFVPPQTHHTERKITLERVSVSDTPFFRTTPYFTNPSLFIGKFLTPLFGKLLKTQTPIYKGGVPTMGR